MNSRRPVIPVEAGIQAAFQVWQSLTSRTVWIPARAALGRNDGEMGSQTCRFGGSRGYAAKF